MSSRCLLGRFLFPIRPLHIDYSTRGLSMRSNRKRGSNDSKPGARIRERWQSSRRHRREFRLAGEQLEDRVLLAVSIWDGAPDAGGSTSNNVWLNPQNWVGDMIPSPGDDLVFPAGAAQLTNVNNFAV